MRDEDLELAETIGDDSATESPTPQEGEVDAPPSPQGDETLKRGTPLGRYIIVEVLGSGGMGIVYSAFDPQLDRKVACKVLRKNWDAAARRRLRREAKAMAKLAHPNVVRVYEVGTEGQHDFVVMELIEGRDAETWSREEHSAKEILGVYQQAGEGLAAAHRVGLVHRDFKPQNVLIDRDGRVLVTDFGLARQDAVVDTESELPPSHDRSFSDGSLNLTETGLIMGTPAYMAPEQHLAEDIDARSDQFGFCVSLYEALSGRRPYSGETYLKLREQVTTQAATPLPDSVRVRQEVREVLAKGLSRNPDERFPSMQELLETLGERRARSAGRRFRLLLAAALLVVATAGVVFLWSDRSEELAACESDPSILEGSWDQQAQAKLNTAFATTGVPGAADAYRAFARRLDSYAASLVDFRQEICEARRGPEGIGDESMVLQMSCLQKRLKGLARLCSRFEDVDASTLWRAVDAAVSLESVATCGDLKALKQGVEAPRPELRRVVESLQSQLEDSRELTEIGALRKALAEIQEVRGQATSIDYKPLRAEAHLEEGLVLKRLTRTAESRKALEEAVLAAEECDHRRVRARALVALTELERLNSSSEEEADVYARQARAAIDLIGGSERLDIRMTRSLAYAKYREGKAEESLSLLTRALKRAESKATLDPIDVAELQATVAKAQISMTRFEDANRLAKMSHQTYLEVMGATHPRRFFSLELLARTHRLLGEYETAHRYDKLVREFWQSESGVDLIRGHRKFEAEHRDASGLVLGPDGSPVDGATVVCGPKIYAGPHFLDDVWSARNEALARFRVSQSDSEGKFACSQTTRKALVLSAEHPDLGRSQPLQAESSDEDAKGLVVRLGPTGKLQVKVAGASKAAGLQVVSLVPVGFNMVDPEYAVGAYIRGDHFSFDRLAPGTYRVSVSGPSKTANTNSRAQQVVIRAGETAKVEFAGDPGSAAVQVTATGAHGTFVKSVQIMVIAGHHEIESGKAFGEKIYGKGVNYRAAFLADGESTLIDGLQAGLHSLCFVPIDGDYRDPEFIRSMTEELRDKLVFHCHDITLVDGETYVERGKVPSLQRD